jgi:tRNA U34 5-methylaminomethyl-2-thiouridine-forming methyltransferase MnmC
LKELIKTADGSHTIYVPEIDEHYHSIHGAIQESEHIFIRAGFDMCQADPLHILEAGFGTGLNAFLTCLRAQGTGKKVIYTTIEKFPLEPEIVSSLNYAGQVSGDQLKLFTEMHSVPWDTKAEITPGFILLKIRADITTFLPEGTYDLVYFDAFGPDKQPEMWTPEIFSGIGALTSPGGILVTYSSKGTVKRNLRSSGFDVKLIPGPPGKRQIIRAIKK